MPCIDFSEVYYTTFLSWDTHSARVRALKLHAKFAPGWALIWVNFDPIQEIGPKVGGGHSFVSGPFFTRLWYLHECRPYMQLESKKEGKDVSRDLLECESSMHITFLHLASLQTFLPNFRYTVKCTHGHVTPPHLGNRWNTCCCHDIHSPRIIPRECECKPF